MRNIILHIIILCGMLINIGTPLTLYSQIKGVIDLSEINFDKENANLDGIWEFYPQELYTPTDFRNLTTSTPTHIYVPKLWNKIENDSIDFQGNFYGTYRVFIKTKSVNRILAININRIQSAYKIWINGKLKAEEGKVGKSKDEMKPRWSSLNIDFFNENKNIEIIIQVSNFYHKKGGIEHSIKIGTVENITSYTWRNLGFDIFLLGVLLIMAMYHFGMFFIQRKDLSNLYFALTLLFFASFSNTVGEIWATRIFPKISWEFLVKLNYVSNYLRLLFFILFIHTLFGKYAKKITLQITLGIGILATIFIIVTPARIYTHTLILFIVFAGLSLIILIVNLIKSVRNNVIGAIWSLVGTIILFLSAINDILLEFQIIKSISLLTFGVFIFVFLQSYMVSRRAYFLNLNVKEKTSNLNMLGKIKNAFLSATNFSFNNPLIAISEVLEIERALIILKINGNWYIKNEYQKKNNQIIETNEDIYDVEKDYLFFSIIKNVILTEQTEQVNTKSCSDLIGVNYMNNNRIKNISCYPFFSKKEISLILYTENKIYDENLSKRNTNIINSLKSQISVFIENHKIYNKLEEFNKELENKVEQKTIEITQQNEELSAQKDKIESQNESLEFANQKLKYQNTEITDSINYSKKIQMAILPNKRYLDTILKDYFIFYEPKEVLSGDFYWATKIKTKNDELTIFAIADCTGHGVTGALMSVIGINLLASAVKEKEIYKPSEILDFIQEKLVSRLNLNKENDNTNDGIDIGILTFSKNKKELQFAGAKHNLLSINNRKLTEYKADDFSIESSAKNIKFINNTISFNENDKFYMFSNGYANQVGEENNRILGEEAVKNLLISTSKFDFKIQNKKIEEQLKNWKKNKPQTDDIIIAGIKF